MKLHQVSEDRAVWTWTNAYRRAGVQLAFVILALAVGNWAFDAFETQLLTAPIALIIVGAATSLILLAVLANTLFLQRLRLDIDRKAGTVSLEATGVWGAGSKGRLLSSATSVELPARGFSLTPRVGRLKFGDVAWALGGPYRVVGQPIDKAALQELADFSGLPLVEPPYDP